MRREQVRETAVETLLGEVLGSCWNRFYYVEVKGFTFVFIYIWLDTCYEKFDSCCSSTKYCPKLVSGN